MFVTRYAVPVRSSAARAAQSRAALAPTFVSGQLFLWDSRANALVHASISRRTNKAAARACHRRYWPETNVGASAARDCAAQAALDLTGVEDATATLARNHRISHKYCTRVSPGGAHCGSWLAGDRARSGNITVWGITHSHTASRTPRFVHGSFSCRPGNHAAAAHPAWRWPALR